MVSSQLIENDMFDNFIYACKDVQASNTTLTNALLLLACGPLQAVTQ